MALLRALVRCTAQAPARNPARLTPHLLRAESYHARTSRPLRRACQYPVVAPRTLATPASPIRTYSHEAAAMPEPPDYLNEAELHIFNKIKAELAPAKLEVQDISGGCGSMYAIEIESPRFEGLTVIKQHKLVNAVLAEEIKQWHGVQLRTRAV